MKKEPDILSFDKWKELWSPDEIESYGEGDNFDGTIDCPSCNGKGTVYLEHSYRDHTGRMSYDNYECECELCCGDGRMELDEPRVKEYCLIDIYNKRLKEEKLKYANYYKMIHGDKE